MTNRVQFRSPLCKFKFDVSLSTTQIVTTSDTNFKASRLGETPSLIGVRIPRVGFKSEASLRTHIPDRLLSRYAPTVDRVVPRRVLFHGEDKVAPSPLPGRSVLVSRKVSLLDRLATFMHHDKSSGICGGLRRRTDKTSANVSSNHDSH